MANPSIEYLTNADIEERLGSKAYVQLADDDGDGTADVGVVDEARLAALGEVNGYLAQRYETPIDTSIHTELAPLLQSISLDLAEYHLRSRRPPVPSTALRRRDQAVVWLRRVASGSISLPSIKPLASNTTRGTIASALGDKRVLSRKTLDDF